MQQGNSIRVPAMTLRRRTGSQRYTDYHTVGCHTLFSSLFSSGSFAANSGINLQGLNLDVAWHFGQPCHVLESLFSGMRGNNCTNSTNCTKISRLLWTQESPMSLLEMITKEIQVKKKGPRQMRRQILRNIVSTGGWTVPVWLFLSVWLIDNISGQTAKFCCQRQGDSQISTDLNFGSRVRLFGFLGRARRSRDGLMESCTCRRRGGPFFLLLWQPWFFHQKKKKLIVLAFSRLSFLEEFFFLLLLLHWWPYFSLTIILSGLPTLARGLTLIVKRPCLLLWGGALSRWYDCWEVVWSREAVGQKANKSPKFCLHIGVCRKLTQGNLSFNHLWGRDPLHQSFCDNNVIPFHNPPSRKSDDSKIDLIFALGCLQYSNHQEELQKIRSSMRRKNREGSAPTKSFSERLAEKQVSGVWFWSAFLGWALIADHTSSVPVSAWDRPTFVCVQTDDNLENMLYLFTLPDSAAATTTTTTTKSRCWQVQGERLRAEQVQGKESQESLLRYISRQYFSWGFLSASLELMACFCCQLLIHESAWVIDFEDTSNVACRIKFGFCSEPGHGAWYETCAKISMAYEFSFHCTCQFWLFQNCLHVKTLVLVASLWRNGFLAFRLHNGRSLRTSPHSSASCISR